MGAEGRSELVLTIEMVINALKKVTKTIVAHRALEIQKQEMRKVPMIKPFEFSTRLTVEALSRINECLPFLPGKNKFLKIFLLICWSFWSALCPILVVKNSF